MGDRPVEVALEIRVQQAEGPLWDAATAASWWVDITGQPGGVILDPDGATVVAAPEGLAVLDRSTGLLEPRVPIEQDRTEDRANDVKVDSREGVWVGTMAFDKRPGRAALYWVEAGGATCVVDCLTISNGPAFDDVQGRLYFADTALSVIDRFDLDLETGTLFGRRRILAFSDEQVWPDGMTVDDEGRLCVALGRAGEVRRFRPDGVLEGLVEVPANSPTSVTFGGARGEDLYVTTSRTDLDDRSRATQPSAGATFRCNPGVTGRPSERLADVLTRADQPDTHLEEETTP